MAAGSCKWLRNETNIMPRRRTTIPDTHLLPDLLIPVCAFLRVLIEELPVLVATTGTTKTLGKSNFQLMLNMYLPANADSPAGIAWKLRVTSMLWIMQNRAGFSITRTIWRIWQMILVPATDSTAGI